MQIPVVVIGLLVVTAEAFLPPLHTHVSVSSLDAEKKRRRRKQTPAGGVGQPAVQLPPPEPVSTANEAKRMPPPPVEPIANEEAVPAPVQEEARVMTDENKSLIAEIAKFKFTPGDIITRGIEDEQPLGGSSFETTDDPLVLPDIKDILKKKGKQQELEKIEEDRKQSIKKIKRSDKEAFTKLLETQPYADADDSLFEQEEYGTVSALLGEGAKSFLGIPPGPLQVGHFIGSLGIFLMAFVEYPGFPLTNLPSPVRVCLQGGLATVYAINAVLAILATFKAGERGQSKALWGIKTFSVGGLAYDQLTQLPTLEEVDEVNSRKGKRAPNKKSR